MLNEQQIIDLVRRGDPVPDEADVAGPRLTAAELLSLVGREEPAMIDTTRDTRPTTTRRPRWRGPAVAVTAMAAVLVIVGAVAVVWNPADETAPAAATCPAGTDPDTMASDQPAGPVGAPSVNQGGAFDTTRGVIVYVDGEGATWTFDVCTNAWDRVHEPVTSFFDYGAGDLVYAAAADRIVGIDTPPLIHVYDAATNTWERHYTRGNARGAVYDPVSRLVVVAHLDDNPTGGPPDTLSLRGFDPLTGEFSDLGTIENVWADTWMFLIGYDPTTDQLILHGGYAPDLGDPLDGRDHGAPVTVLHSIRTGVTEVIPGGPSVFAPWGLWYPYANGADGAVLVVDIDDEPQLCRFDVESRTWGDCVARPDSDVRYDPRYRPDTSTMVHDPINDRLVIIYAQGDVWAVDLDTGTWTPLAES